VVSLRKKFINMLFLGKLMSARSGVYGVYGRVTIRDGDTVVKILSNEYYDQLRKHLYVPVLLRLYGMSTPLTLHGYLSSPVDESEIIMRITDDEDLKRNLLETYKNNMVRGLLFILSNKPIVLDDRFVSAYDKVWNLRFNVVVNISLAEKPCAVINEERTESEYPGTYDRLLRLIWLIGWSDVRLKIFDKVVAGLLKIKEINGAPELVVEPISSLGEDILVHFASRFRRYNAILLVPKTVERELGSFEIAETNCDTECNTYVARTYADAEHARVVITNTRNNKMGAILIIRSPEYAWIYIIGDNKRFLDFAKKDIDIDKIMSKVREVLEAPSTDLPTEGEIANHIKALMMQYVPSH